MKQRTASGASANNARQPKNRRAGWPSAGAVLTLLAATAVVGTTASAAPKPSGGSITVNVFRDYNANGERNTTGDTSNPAVDSLVAGATLTATCLTNNGPDGVDGSGDTETYAPPVAATDIGDGTYIFSSLPGTPCRVEATALPSGFQPGPLGVDNGGLVQFASVGSTIQIGINKPAEFCQNNPQLATSCMVAGFAQAATLSGRGVESFSTAQSTTFNTPITAGTSPGTLISSVNQTGTTYGNAWSAATRQLYVSAYLRRKAPLGSSGLGAIYRIDTTNTNATSLFADLGSLFPGSVGTNPRSATPDYTDDTESVGLIGKAGIGDIDLSTDGSTLYAMALGNRTLYALPTSGPVNATTVQAYPLPTPASCATDTVRPFGIGVDVESGQIYAGGVCSAQPSGLSANLRFYVWTLTGGTFSLVLDSTVTTGRGIGPWAAWDDVDQAAILTKNPQPMLTDIAVQGNNLVLGIRDRYGDQAPGAGLDAAAAPAPRGFGDLVLACGSGGAYTLETAGGCAPSRISTDPSTKEFYFQDRSGDGNLESGNGALAQIPGWTGIFDTAYDPVSYDASGPTVTDFNGGGVQYHSNVTGEQLGNFELFKGTQDYFGKSSGMGDLVALCDRAPVEVGNRVWIDTNRNGVQDPGEQPVPDVTVTLIVDPDGSGPLPSATYNVQTDSNGVYLFSSDNRFTDAAGKNYAVADLLPGATFTLQVPNVLDHGGNALGLTAADRGSDTTDSDASPSTGTTATFTVGAPGQNNHTYDFGFTPEVYDLALAKVVTSGGPVSVNGDRVSWTVRVQNQGTVASGDFTVTDRLPTGMAFVSASNGGSASGGVVTWTNPGSLAPGAFVDLTLVTSVTDITKAPFRNWAEISADSGPDDDSTPDTNTGQDNTLPNDGYVGVTDLTTLSTDGPAGPEPTGTTDADDNDDALVVSQVVAVGDYTWIDTDRDGVQDASEPVLAGVTVTLLNADGSPARDAAGVLVPAAVTDANGFYLFDNLVPGDYRVQFTLPAGYVFTQSGAGTSATDSNPNPATGLTPVFTIAASASGDTVADTNPATKAVFVNPTIDAGVVQVVAVGDYVWHDVDHDGVQDAGENPVAGVTVTLLNPDGTQAVDAAGVPVAPTTTDAAGHYVFDNLVPGDYKIQFSTLPSGYVFTIQGSGGGTDSNPSDTGLTPVFTLTTASTGDMRAPQSGDGVSRAAAINPTIDAGIWNPIQDSRASTPTTTVPVPGPKLPTTGGDVMSLLATALLALLAGGLVVVGSRRRRSA